MLNTRNIVEVQIINSLGRVRKKRILGVWKNAEDIPFDKIRMVNEKVYRGCTVEVKVTAYEGP
jgi:hypothetical protein